MKKAKLNKKNLSILLVSLMMLSLMFTIDINIDAQRLQSQNGINEVIEKLDENLPKLMKSAGVPGVQIAFIDGDKIITKEYGYSNKGKKTKVAKDTMFQVGSVSKMVSAWGVMKLVEDGKIDLDKPVQNYLTRWNIPQSEYNSEGVTARRLLSHTAGLSLQGYAGIKPSKTSATIEESLSGNTNGAGDVRLIYQPGSRFQYSGGGYTLLQLLVEETSDMAFEKYLEEQILVPLDMNNSSFEASEQVINKTSKAYGALGQKRPNYIYTEKAAAGLYSTAEDLAKLGLEVLNTTGKALKPSTINSMIQKVDNTNWGLGFQVGTIDDEVLSVGHGGANRGWRAHFNLLPQKKQGVVILTNGDMGDTVIAEITAYWRELQTGKFPQYVYANRGFAKSILTIGLVLGGLCLLSAIIVLMSIIKGKRKLSLFREKRILIKLLRLLPTIIGGIAWWIGFYGPIIRGWSPAPFLPYSFKWITISVTMWCGLFIVTGLFPKEKKKV